jgi:hypothetical protein
MMNMTFPEQACGRPSVNREKMTLMSIWVLANEESFRGVADRFGLERGHAHRIFLQWCNAVLDITSQYIIWPTGR